MKAPLKKKVKTRKPINGTGTYGINNYDKILEHHFNRGVLRPWADGIKEYEELYKTARDIILPVADVGGRKPRGIVAASLRIASEDNKRPIRMDELRKTFEVTEVCIRNNKKYLLKANSRVLLLNT